MDDEPLVKRLTHYADDIFLKAVEDVLEQQLGAPRGAPPPGSDVDDWLDWRERRKQRGKWYRLDEIARFSGYTIAQLKYKSSLRKPRGTPKPAAEKKKKLKKTKKLNE